MSSKLNVGRRTGTVLVGKNVRQDAEGFEDVDSFWGSGEAKSGNSNNSNQISPVTGQGSSPKTKKASARFSTGGASNLSSVATPTNNNSRSYGLTDVSNSFSNQDNDNDFVNNDDNDNEGMMNNMQDSDSDSFDNNGNGNNHRVMYNKQAHNKNKKNKYNLSRFSSDDDDSDSDSNHKPTFDDEEDVSDESPVKSSSRDALKDAKHRRKKETEKRARKALIETEKKERAQLDAFRRKSQQKRLDEAEDLNDVEAPQPHHTRGNMNYVPVTDGEDDDNDSQDQEDDDRVRDNANANGNRRSKRKRFEPLKFWKNERLVFKPSGQKEILHNTDTVTAVAMLEALPTPAKPKRAGAGAGGGAAGGGRSRKNEKALGKDFDVRGLPYEPDKIMESTEVWDELSQTTRTRKVVVRSDLLEPSDLPLSIERPDGNEMVGSAAQAFNIGPSSSTMPGWITGNLILPPNAIKDAEGVGECTQVFFVQQCQPGAFEVAINHPDEESFVPESAKRFALKSGDFFHVPPNNIYMIHNHSESVDAKLFWVIIKTAEEVEAV